MVMVPFYCAVAALFIGIFGGFCARCYQISNGKNFPYILKISALNIVENSRTAFCLPFLVVFSYKFRRMLLDILIHEAEENYTVSISDTDKESLINVLLEKVSVYDITKIAISLSCFYFINLDRIANSTMRSVSETTQNKTMTFKLWKSSFWKGLSFYKRNTFAQTIFCL